VDRVIERVLRPWEKHGPYEQSQQNIEDCAVIFRETTAGCNTRL